MMNTTGTIFNIMRFAVNDGPGIRTTVFLKGCPLDCWWCHNPESQARGPQLQFWADRCIGCGACVAACPYGIPAGQRPSAPFRTDPACAHCGRCAAACPAQARSVVGWRASVAEVIREIVRDTVFYDESGGGATFSGGEPLAQPEFLLSLLGACRTRYIHTCVDTSGYAARSTLLEAAAHTDLFLYDVKLIDPELHLKYTGGLVAIVLDNLRALSEVHNNINVRIPIIPGINDGDDNILRTGEFVAGLKGVRDVTLLPYHATGVAKYQRLGRPWRMAGSGPLPPTGPAAHPDPGPDTPPPGRLEEIARLLVQGFGLRVQIGG